MRAVGTEGAGRRRRHLAVPMALALMLLATACGTRLSHGDILASHGLRAGRGGAAAGATSAGDEAALGDAGGTGVGAQGAASGGAGGGAAAGTAGKAGTSGGASGAGGSAPNSGGGARGTITLGSVGTLSGIAGAAEASAPPAVQAWAQMVNARGGINGYTFKIIVQDDGADPARYQSEIKDLVENKGAFAFVANMASFTLQAGKDYLEAKRVPVVGGDDSTPAWNTSQMFFPEGTAAHASPFAMASTLAKQTNKKKFGAMTCREAQGCRDADHYWFDLHDIERAGLTPGYRGQVSIAQPDYTAECLQAKNNGSDLLGTIADAASIIRIGRDCARQAYHPVFISGLAALENRMAADPNLDGMFGMLDVFPWTLQSGGAAEFHAAMSKYAAGVELSGSASEGWASAKLFEKAFTAATAGGAPADREKLLTALYSMNGETLGGLTPPLTFVRGQPAPETKCWFYLQIQGGKWTSNGQVLCP